jgi:hypothetical protein
MEIERHESKAIAKKRQNLGQSYTF